MRVVGQHVDQHIAQSHQRGASAGEGTSGSRATRAAWRCGASPSAPQKAHEFVGPQRQRKAVALALPRTFCSAARRAEAGLATDLITIHVTVGAEFRSPRSMGEAGAFADGVLAEW